MGRPRGIKSDKPNRYWSTEAKREHVRLVMEGEAGTMRLARENNISSGTKSLKEYLSKTITIQDYMWCVSIGLILGLLYIADSRLEGSNDIEMNRFNSAFTALTFILASILIPLVFEKLRRGRKHDE